MKAFNVDQKVIEEGNTLCAKFMDPDIPVKKTIRLKDSSLCYHNDWLFLMPVIDKIEAESEVRFILLPDECTVQGVSAKGFFDTHFTYASSTRIESAFGAVVLYLRSKEKTSG